MVAAMPLVSIDLLMVRNGDEVLLGRRNNRPAQGTWFVPGGRIFKDERIAQARERIIRRELGDAVPTLGWRLIGAFDHLYPDNFAGAPGVSTHYVVLAFRLDVEGAGPALCMDEQHEALTWMPMPSAVDDPLVHENTKAYLR
jgi:colanic acid biosynthesis protein WcaH